MFTITMTTEARSGIGGLHKLVDWPHMPRAGEVVQLAPEIAEARVQDVAYDIDGSACVDLGAQDLDPAEVAYMVTDSWVPTGIAPGPVPSALAELHKQVAAAVVERIEDEKARRP
jgi:hypothetical protein